MGAQIGKYLHPDKLKQIVVGEDFRKKFNGLWYDGKMESINLDNKLYRIKYNNGDLEEPTI